MNGREELRAWSLALALSAGCATVGPDYQAPERALPESFTASAGSVAADEAAAEGPWWGRLGDPLLTGLVERATAAGLDMRLARARLREARALRAIAASERYPRIDAELSYAQSGESENTQFGGFVRDTELWSAGLDASWELDLWGGRRRAVEAADAALQASIEDSRAVLVSLAAETARQYVELRTFQRRHALAETNVRLQSETLELVRARYDAGLVGERDLAQAEANLETTRSLLPSLRSGVLAAANRLAVLVGETPGSLSAELLLPAPIPSVPERVAVGVPADLLRRRPDVRRAERELAAETARIGVSEAALYPSLGLGGRLGFSAESLGDLLEERSLFFRVGPTLRLNLFDASRERWLVLAQDARAEAALARWEASVLAALEECENAIHAFGLEQERLGRLATAARQARRAVELAEAQYQEGLSDFQSVLDSERQLVGLEDSLVQSEAALATGLVRLYKALGGGWEPEADPAGPAPAPSGS